MEQSRGAVSYKAIEVVVEVDINDHDKPITVDAALRDIKKWFYIDRTNECFDLLKFVEAMLSSHKVVSAE
jgi:hypothetical protein